MYIQTRSAEAYMPSYYNLYDPHDGDIYINDSKYIAENYTFEDAIDFIDDEDLWQDLEEEFLFRFPQFEELPEPIEDLAYSGKLDKLIQDWLFNWKEEVFAEWLYDRKG